jgi:hypothetical protein
MSNEGLKIARMMHRAKVSLIGLGLDEKCAGDVAFHLAELQSDLGQLTEFIKKAGRGKPLSVKEISAIDGMLRVHTHYHYQHFRQALAKSVKKLGRERIKSKSGN